LSVDFFKSSVDLFKPSVDPLELCRDPLELRLEVGVLQMAKRSRHISMDLAPYNVKMLMISDGEVMVIAMVVEFVSTLDPFCFRKLNARGGLTTKDVATCRGMQLGSKSLPQSGM
jgi:hypothetical protein